MPVFFASGLEQARIGVLLDCGSEVAGHAVRVRRMSAGEDLQLIDGSGTRVTGTIAEAAPDSLTVTVTGVDREAAPRPRLVLVQALAKQERDLQAIEAATEVGVDEVIPWAAARSIADWPAKKHGKMAAKWANTLQAAALQARRARVPLLHDLARGHALRERFGTGDHVLVLHEEATVRLPAAVAAAPEDVERLILVVGPEGGISAEEITAFEAVGALPVRLGDTVLRASSAGPVGLALCQLLLGRWDDADSAADHASGR
nr:16S rRNA (uracil(1498)-N(3))-methyltransferase [Brevibacterium daeguense]